MKATRAALKELLRTREEEGESLGRDLEKNLSAVDKLRARIEKRMPGVVKARQADLHRRINLLSAGACNMSDPCGCSQQIGIFNLMQFSGC